MRWRNPAQAEAERDRRRALGTKALVVLSTPRDGKAEWLQAGGALQRVLLRATAAGLFASYFTQAIEAPELRRRLADAIGDPGAPQIMFRLGYGLEPRPTPRRAVEDVLRRMDCDSPRGGALAVRRAPAAASTSRAASDPGRAGILPPPPGPGGGTPGQLEAR